MSRPPASEPRCLRCDIATDLHAVEVKNTAWWFRARLCDACYRELARRTGYSPSMISMLERGKIKSWPRYIERLTVAIRSEVPAG